MKKSILSFALVAALSLCSLGNANAQFFAYKNGKPVVMCSNGIPFDSISFVAPAPVKIKGSIPTKAQAVDLGLSVLWAPYNLGATDERQAGAFMAWGETQSKEYFDWGTYKWMTPGCNAGWAINKYQINDHLDGGYTNPNATTKGVWYDYSGSVPKFIGDGKNKLESADDPVTANWGNGWRLPTREDFIEMAQKCDVEYVANYKNTGNAAFIVKGRGDYAGNQVVFVSAGCKGAQGVVSPGIGLWWTSQLYSNTSQNARVICFELNGTTAGFQTGYCYPRNMGYMVRGVIAK